MCECHDRASALRDEAPGMHQEQARRRRNEAPHMSAADSTAGQRFGEPLFVTAPTFTGDAPPPLAKK